MMNLTNTILPTLSVNDHPRNYGSLQTQSLRTVPSTGQPCHKVTPPSVDKQHHIGKHPLQAKTSLLVHLITSLERTRVSVTAFE